MKRLLCKPRENWQELVTSQGLTYHTHENGPYWSEGVYYEFTTSQVDQIEAATNELHELCIKAAEHIIEKELWSELNIPHHVVPGILQSWERDDFSLYGRFDLAYDGKNPPKLLEYNADTPTSLIEAAIAQWFWKEDVFPNQDQFNSIHENLIAAWKKSPATLVHFAGIEENLEDHQTISYLVDTAIQAGLDTKWLAMNEIGYDEERADFVDTSMSKVLRTLFKLYPWEWMFDEEFGQYLSTSRVQFIEPLWKSLLSNKAILPILWKLFPNHPNLLPAYRNYEPLGNNYVRKPILSREGANVSIVKNGSLMIQTPGEYGDGDSIYQAIADIPSFNGFRPVIGSWVVNHYACGIGIREDNSLVTGNLSRFVPHIFI